MTENAGATGPALVSEPLRLASRDSFIYILLGAAILLLGLAQLLVLPPFEGFDEIAHYSYMREIADTGKLPVQGKSTLDQQIIDYCKQAPFTYEKSKDYFICDSVDYHEYFVSNASREAFVRDYRQSGARTFVPTKLMNWQVQHPPLYYLITAGLMKATDNLSFVAQLFVLRLFSFLLAFAGLMIGLRGSLRATEPALRRQVITAVLLYPFIAPMFFSEFGRLGNDSLCLFIMGLTWSLILRWTKDEHNIKQSLALGLCLGLGLLTKGFFIPITAGFGLLALTHLWRDRFSRRRVGLWLADMELIFTPVLCAGLFYLYKFVSTGALVGNKAFMLLSREGGLIQGLIEYPPSFRRLIMQILNIVISWIWVNGTQSQVYLPLLVCVPIYLLSYYLMSGYLRRIKKSSVTESSWIPVWIVAPFVLGLVYHALAASIHDNEGGTPGWYLHIVAPALAFAFAYALQNIEQRPFDLKRIKLLLGYAVIFFFIQAWSQMALFAGCAVKSENKKYLFPGHFACFDRFHDIVRNLSVFGWPILALALYGCGLGCLCFGLWRIINRGPEIIYMEE